MEARTKEKETVKISVSLVVTKSFHNKLKKLMEEHGYTQPAELIKELLRKWVEEHGKREYKGL